MSQNPLLSPGSIKPAGAGSSGSGRSVDAGQGWAWIVGGFDLFKKQPGMWIAVVIIFVLILVAFAFLNVIFFLGSIATLLLTPVFAGGLMLGCRTLQGGGQLEIEHLFAGFKAHTGNLIALGALSLVGGIVVILPMVLIVGVGSFFGATQGDAAGAMVIGGSLMIGWLVTMALSILLYMALWFAPALVVLRGAAPMAAITASFFACLKNFIPFLIYGIVTLVLGIIASIPLGLGWLVLGPVVIASIFVAYRDIFGDA